MSLLFHQMSPSADAGNHCLKHLLTGAAVAFAKTISGGKENEAQQATQCPSDVGLSPGKRIELRMKNFEQLRYLQQLFEDQILDEKEYVEQKGSILLSVRKLK